MIPPWSQVSEALGPEDTRCHGWGGTNSPLLPCPQLEVVACHMLTLHDLISTPEASAGQSFSGKLT